MFWFVVVKIRQRWFISTFRDLRGIEDSLVFGTSFRPEASNQVSIRAACRWTGARVVDVGNQRVWWGAYHCLKVDTGVWQWRNWQSPFPAYSRCHSGAGEAWHCRTDNKEVFFYTPAIKGLRPVFVHFDSSEITVNTYFGCDRNDEQHSSSILTTHLFRSNPSTSFAHCETLNTLNLKQMTPQIWYVAPRRITLSSASDSVTPVGDWATVWAPAGNTVTDMALA